MSFAMKKKHLLLHALHLLFPPRCLGCQLPLPSNTSPQICQTCLEDIRPLQNPHCICCGRPLLIDDEAPTTRCPPCSNTRPQFDQARSLFDYSGVIASAICACKYGRDLKPLDELLHISTPLILDYLSQLNLLAQEEDMSISLIPIPMHRWALIKRGFNQAVFIADAIASLEPSIHVNNSLLTKPHHTPSQAGILRSQRAKHTQPNRFRVSPSRLARTPDNHLFLLIDDVYTSGATLNAAAQSLRLAGARNIYALTIARARADT